MYIYVCVYVCINRIEEHEKNAFHVMSTLQTNCHLQLILIHIAMSQYGDTMLQWLQTAMCFYKNALKFRKSSYLFSLYTPALQRLIQLWLKINPSLLTESKFNAQGAKTLSQMLRKIIAKIHTCRVSLWTLYEHIPFNVVFVADILQSDPQVFMI